MWVVSFDLVRNRTRNGRASDGRSGRWFFVRLPRCVARARSAVCRASAQAGLHAKKKKTQVTASDVVSSHVFTKKSGERIAPRFSTQQKRGTVIISYMLLLCSPGISPKISNFRTRWRKWQRDLVLTIAGF